MQDVKKPNSTTTENQSAVDFLINQWLYLDTEFEMGLMDKNTYWQKLREIQAQAKEMDKKNLYNFYMQGGVDAITEADRNVEQYYNETFKSE
jgi:hypothetical protein